MKKAVIYARVSTKNQTVQNQIQALRDAAIAARILRQKGASIGTIAKQLKIGVGSVYKALEAA